MGDLAVRSEIVDFATGEVLDPRDTERVASLLERLRYHKDTEVMAAIHACEDALIAESQTLGTKTIRSGEYVAKISGGSELQWDIEVLERLQEAGLPEERWNQLVRTEITYKVDAAVAKQLEGANEEYAEIIAAARQRIEKPQYVSVKRA